MSGERARRMLRWQWQANIATAVFSTVAIGLAFAQQNVLAQLAMLPVLGCFIFSCVIAYRRYSSNKTRREEILSQLDNEQDNQLRELFDSARQQRRLPPDAQSGDGYTAEIERLRTKSAENMPPGIKRRGGNERD